MTLTLKLSLVAAAAIAGVALPAAVTMRSATESTSHVPSATLVEPAKGTREVAVLAGGCFWGVEAVYEHVKGVIDVRSGYAGGGTAMSYEAVSSGKTRKAEAVRIVFNPQQVSYAELLRIFFAVVHDPTEVNRRALTSVHNIELQSFLKRPFRHGSLAPISPSSAKLGFSISRSPRRSSPAGSSRPSAITRISCGETRPTLTS